MHNKFIESIVKSNHIHSEKQFSGFIDVYSISIAKVVINNIITVMSHTCAYNLFHMKQW